MWADFNWFDCVVLRIAKRVSNDCVVIGIAERVGSVCVMLGIAWRVIRLGTGLIVWC
jgi:hypothetical protein